MLNAKPSNKTPREVANIQCKSGRCDIIYAKRGDNIVNVPEVLGQSFPRQQQARGSQSVACRISR